MKTYMTPRDASETLGISIEQLRRLADRGALASIRTPGGHRRYDVQGYLDEQRGTTLTTIGYCRVSGRNQADALNSQVAYIQRHYPDVEIIKDYGSGINFKRKGLKTLLERLLRGDKLRVVIAHRDRLARFGSELIQYLVEQNGGEVVVLNEKVYSPREELRQDLLSILHVFSHRLHGLRRYREAIKADADLSNAGAVGDPE